MSASYESARIVRRYLAYCCCLALGLLAACTEPARLPPLGVDSTVLAFGDSLTYGTGAGREQAYPAVLQNLTGIEVVNAGVPGETSVEGLRRLPAALDRTRPDLVILCHGGNDILRRMDRGAMQQNLLDMIALARQRDIAVVLLAVPDFSLLLSAADEYDAIVELTGVPYGRDFIPKILKRGSLKADHIHPNAEGYRQLAEAVKELLVDAGALQN